MTFLMHALSVLLFSPLTLRNMFRRIITCGLLILAFPGTVRAGNSLYSRLFFLLSQGENGETWMARHSDALSFSKKWRGLVHVYL